MKIPWALRVDLILAILKGEVISLSYWDNTYRFDIPSKSADRWRRRNARVRKVRVREQEVMGRFRETGGTN